jgi:CheY-like chemotaxis protein
MPNELFTQVAGFFERQSALANFITIATPIVALLAWLKRDAIAAFVDSSRKSVTTWIDRTLGDAGQQLSKAAVASVQIAIIDDQPQDFPVDYLRSLGYQVTIFQQFSLSNSEQLKNYDLLILDITGVISEDLKKGGLQLLRNVKQLPHPPTVIAVSGKTYDPTVTQFFRLAEAQMKKPVGKIEFEDKIKQLLGATMSPHALAQKIDASLDQLQLPPRRARTATRRIIKAIT